MPGDISINEKYPYLLTTEEQDRFMVWCQNEANTAKQFIINMEKANMHKAIIDREKYKVFAYGFVANELNKTESFTVSKEKEGNHAGR